MVDLTEDVQAIVKLELDRLRSKASQRSVDGTATGLEPKDVAKLRTLVSALREAQLIEAAALDASDLSSMDEEQLEALRASPRKRT